ncbi:hypothetical protein STCU_09928 [Strigomonas culicis]|uniref:Uncharacterized protein n=1 Tax=Strigomonas culicis TaxID=28005 RepID=S9TPN3_9TRYP|nr:hypothetical protein STCU_09928 [Strigomonas culicis]|eukprot:EPY18423.1 hypothetical protein STCU_09928 [Strigomonas culicis]
MSTEDTHLPFVCLTVETPVTVAREVGAASTVFFTEDDLSKPHRQPYACLRRSHGAACREDCEQDGDVSDVPLTPWACGHKPCLPCAPQERMALRVSQHLPTVEVTTAAHDGAGVALSPLSDMVSALPWSDLSVPATGPVRDADRLNTGRTMCVSARGSSMSGCRVPSMGALTDYSVDLINKSVIEFSVSADKRMRDLSTARDMTELELVSIFDMDDNSADSHTSPVKDEHRPSMLEKQFILISSDNSSYDLSPTKRTPRGERRVSSAVCL